MTVVAPIFHIATYGILCLAILYWKKKSPSTKNMDVDANMSVSIGNMVTYNIFGCGE